VNIGIIVHSQTGNTHSVALKLKEKLVTLGNEVGLERLKITGEDKPGKKDVTLEKIPEAGKYDTIIFASPVQAFSLSPVMATYLKQINSLKDKNVGCLMTQYFPFPFLGGNRAMRQIISICVSKGATIFGTGIVNWSRSGREEQISKIIESMAKQISKLKQN
jgi:flavodoxin